MNDRYAVIAHLLDYPGDDYPDSITHALRSGRGAVHSHLEEFLQQVEQLGVARLQEIYIETFDFHADTSPYIGHHLFGEDIRRSRFMVELRGRYGECGVVENSEVPDHLANVLRFLGATAAGEERSELIHACLIPALQHMLRALKPDNPYTPLLQAILVMCQQETTAGTGAGEIAWMPFYSSSFPTSR